MITNPFTRRRRTPLDQALDALDGARSEAAEAASTIRDAAAKVADALGEAAPAPAGRRLPLIAAVAAGGLGIALALRARAARKSAPPVPAGSNGAAPTETAVETAARTTGPVQPQAAATKPAAQVAPERPREPKADTEESEAGSA